MVEPHYIFYSSVYDFSRKLPGVGYLQLIYAFGGSNATNGNRINCNNSKLTANHFEVLYLFREVPVFPFMSHVDHTKALLKYMAQPHRYYLVQPIHKTQNLLFGYPL